MTQDAPLDRFLRALRGALPARLASGHGPVALARAPGRLDVLGGGVRFAGTTCVSYPLEAGVTVAVRAASGREISLTGEDRSARAQDDDVVVPFDGLLGLDDAARSRELRSDARRAWAAGIVDVLLRGFVRAGRAPEGLVVDVRSDLPEGVGFASGAALVAAAGRAGAALLGVEGDGWIDDVDAARRAADATASRCDVAAVSVGPAGRFLPILAQPCELLEAMPPPVGVEPVAFDLGAPSAAPERRRLRVAAAMAYRIMAGRMGLTVRTFERGDPQEVEDPFYGGWLGNCDPVTFTNEFLEGLPERQRGEVFLDAYGGLADAAVCVDPGVEYPVREAAGFVLGENQRACLFVDALHRPPSGERSPAELLGAQLAQSEREARQLSLVPREAAALVDALIRRGAKRGVYGARATGGGAVVALVDANDSAERALREAVAEWERSCGREAHLRRGTSAASAATFTP